MWNKFRHKTQSFRRHRLSARLLGVFLITGLVLILTIAMVFSGAWRGEYQRSIQPHLELYVDYIKSDIGDPPNLQAAEQLAKALEIDIFVNGPKLRWSSSGERLIPDEIDIFERRRTSVSRIEFGEYDHDRFLVRTSSGPLEITFLTRERRHRDGGGFILFLILGAVFFVLLGCYHALKWLLKPIGELEDGVKRIGAGELEHRIYIDRKDELGSLANSVNGMADDLQRMLEAKRQLLLAISHELRSPLTRMKVSTALLADGSHAQNISRDVAEMERLISELLEAERLNTRHVVLNIESVDISELVDECLREDFSNEPINAEFPEEPVLCQLDPVRIKLMVRNLLANAVRHNRSETGAVSVRLQTKGGQLVVRVSDCGEGMSEEQVRKSTEPFWRQDSSRTRATGGFGLGLYLCQNIARAHGGTLQIESEQGKGTVVEAWLPLNQDLTADELKQPE